MLCIINALGIPPVRLMGKKNYPFCITLTLPHPNERKMSLFIFSYTIWGICAVTCWLAGWSCPGFGRGRFICNSLVCLSSLLLRCCCCHQCYVAPLPLLSRHHHSMEANHIPPWLISVDTLNNNHPSIHHLQAILFYTPRYLWKMWEGGKIHGLIMDLDVVLCSQVEKRAKKRLLLEYLWDNLK